MRPLNLTTEYADYAAATSQDNVRLTTDASGLAGKTIQSLLFDNGATNIAVAGDGVSTLTIGGGAILFSGAGSVNFSGFTALDFGGSPGFIFVTQPSAAVEIAASVQGSGGLTKSGPGTLTLSAPNSFVGGLYLNAGTLLFADGANLGDPAGTIVFGGGTLRPTSGAATLGTRAITLLAGGGTLDTNGFDLTIGPGNAISGAGMFTKVGAGILTLAGTNGYAGGTTITGGVVVVAGDASLGAAEGPLAVANAVLRASGDVVSARNVTITSATIDTAGFNISLSGFITGGGIVKNGAGTLSLSGTSNSFAGGLIVNGGTLQVGSELTIGAPGTIALANNAVLKLTADLIFTNSARIFTVASTGGTIDTNGFDLFVPGGTSLANTGIFIKTGLGTMTIESQSGSGLIRVLQGTLKSRSAGSGNFLTGGVFVEAGATLDLNGNGESFGALNGSGSVLLGNGGDLGSSSSAQNTFNGVISGVGDVSFGGGNGSITLGGASTYVGTTTVGTNHTMRFTTTNALPVTTELTVLGTLQLNGFSQSVGALLGASGSVVIGTSSSIVLTVGTGHTGSASYGGVVSGPGGLHKVGPGSQSFSAVNTFAGPLEVQAGTLVVDAGGSMSGVASVSVASGALLNVVGAVGGGTTAMASAGMFTGTGSLLGNLTVTAGGGIAPGNGSPAPTNGIGTLMVAGTGDAVLFEGGSHFYFDFRNAGGVAPGTDWDLLNLTLGRLVIDADAADPLTIHVAADPTASFDPVFGNYQWKIAQATEIFFAGDSPANSIVLDTSGVFGAGAPFENQLGSGAFYVTSHDNSLYLNYSSVPEPSSFALCGMFGGLFWWRRRRRGTKQCPAPIPEYTSN